MKVESSVLIVPIYEDEFSHFVTVITNVIYEEHCK